MRIAFDLDDTLIPGQIPFPLESLPWDPIRRWACSERLRRGAPALMNELWDAGHDVAIYTTSLRGVFPTKLFFRAHGTRVSRVINVPIHRRRMGQLDEHYKMCSKYPPAFDIDLLVDNCDGVVLEGQRYCFEVLQVSPEDDQWADKVRQAVR